MGNLIIPGQKHKLKKVKTVIMIPFVFADADSMDTIITKLDFKMKQKREEVIVAIAKVKNIKLKWK